MIPEDLTIEQAAAFLGIRSPHTVKTWLEGGSFPGSYRDDEGNWRFSVAQLEDVLEHMTSYRDRFQPQVDLVVVEH